MLITTEELRNHLGVDDDADSIKMVEDCRQEALCYLTAATGMVFTDETAVDGLVNSAVRTHAWLNFHTLRGGAGNPDVLQRNLTMLINQLRSAPGGAGIV